MCGIFGIICPKNILRKDELISITNKLFLLSESRGKESSGLAINILDNNIIHVLKKSIPASELIKHKEYEIFLEKVFCENITQGTINSPIALIAHTRLVTNGKHDNNNNNQPVIKSDSVIVHNGIITNTDILWKKHQSLRRDYEVDTELLASILMKELQIKNSFIDATLNTYNEIEGTATIAVLFAKYNSMLIATNNASLYYSYSLSKGLFVFASEEYILKKTIIDLALKKKHELNDIVWVTPNQGIIIDIKTSEQKTFNFKPIENTVKETESKSSSSVIIDYSVRKSINSSNFQNNIPKNIYTLFENEYVKNAEIIFKIQRCKNCLLPISFPYIQFDEKGICNYCQTYKPCTPQQSKIEELKKVFLNFNIPKNKPNCIVPFSGGRDSSFGLHYIVNELKLKPVTFTYDWGMITDLARRNIARVCGKLGVENILVSANISKKRINIRKNVEAWLKKPELGMIPLFMAGDKHFFYYVNIIKKQTGIPIDIWMGNRLEDTNFKIGFANVAPNFDKDRIDRLTLLQKGEIVTFYLKNFIKNPKYINSSLIDTIWAFYSYYSEPRKNYYLLYDYIPWSENEIERILINEYNWETDTETQSTWRIGDGTAAFYNFIYYTVAGFTENDTFRSNQIREGLIYREDAFFKVLEENKPRWRSIKWYCDTIGIDFKNTIMQINKIKKLY